MIWDVASSFEELERKLIAITEGNDIKVVSDFDLLFPNIDIKFVNTKEEMPDKDTIVVTNKLYVQAKDLYYNFIALEINADIEYVSLDFAGSCLSDDDDSILSNKAIVSYDLMLGNKPAVQTIPKVSEAHRCLTNDGILRDDVWYILENEVYVKFLRDYAMLYDSKRCIMYVSGRRLGFVEKFIKVPVFNIKFTGEEPISPNVRVFAVTNAYSDPYGNKMVPIHDELLTIDNKISVYYKLYTVMGDGRYKVDKVNTMQEYLTESIDTIVSEKMFQKLKEDFMG